MAPRPLRQTSVRSRPSKAAETRSISNLDASAGLVDKNPELRDRSQHEEGRVLEAVYVYPIKSCAPQRARARERPVYRAQNSARREAGASTRTLVTVVVAGAGHGRSVPPPEVEEGRPCWPLGPTGLAYDREWAVVDRRNRALRLKQVCYRRCLAFTELLGALDNRRGRACGKSVCSRWNLLGDCRVATLSGSGLAYLL